MHPFHGTIEQIQCPRLSETLCVKDLIISAALLRLARISDVRGRCASSATDRSHVNVNLTSYNCKDFQRRTQHRLQNHSISEPERNLSEAIRYDTRRSDTTTTHDTKPQLSGPRIFSYLGNEARGHEGKDAEYEIEKFVLACSVNHPSYDELPIVR